MATNTFVEIHFPEAAELADLTGILYDLESARSMAQLLVKVLDDEKLRRDFVDPLSTAILVRYSRPFVTGVRKWLGEEGLKVLDSQQRKKHERLRAFRDKHIAHSVNAFEENQPVARYWLERVKDEGITSIECNHTRIIGMSSADLEDVIELSTAMLSYVEARLKEEKTRVLEIVRQIPVEQILAQPQSGPVIPDLTKIDRGRKR